jgi:hypothetical protein
MPYTGEMNSAMTSSGPDPTNRNPFDPPSSPPPVDSSIEGLNSYFARQPAGHGVDPLSQPDLFVRPARRPSPWRQRLITLGVFGLALACCGGLAYTVGGSNDDKPKASSAAATTPSPTPKSSYNPSPTPPATTKPPTTAPPAPSQSSNALDGVKENDCLKNTGTDADPEMVPTPCGRGAYKVLKRLYGTIDTSQCQTVRGTTASYTVTYYRNGIPVIGLSYVFCLKKV